MLLQSEIQYIHPSIFWPLLPNFDLLDPKFLPTPMSPLCLKTTMSAKFGRAFMLQFFLTYWQSDSNKL